MFPFIRGHLNEQKGCDALTELMTLIFLFAAKILDNALSTGKTILIQRNKGALAGIAVAISSLLYFSVIKNVVSAENNIAMLVVSLASGIGCYMAVVITNRFSKERTYVNVVMSDDKEAVKDFRDFLAEHHITNVAADSYTMDWQRKTITVAAYAETKEESRLITQYLNESTTKFKRLIQKV